MYLIITNLLEAIRTNSVLSKRELFYLVVGVKIPGTNRHLPIINFREFRLIRQKKFIAIGRIPLKNETNTTSNSIWATSHNR